MKAIDVEAAAIQDGFERDRKQGQHKMAFSRAQQEARERVSLWIDQAQEERIDLTNPAKLAEYVISHRRSKTWATLIGLAD